MITTVGTDNFIVTFLYRGDVTQALIHNNNPLFIEGFGQVTRHPNDTSDRLIGEKYALTAALKNSGLNRAQRTLIWQAYRNR